MSIVCPSCQCINEACSSFCYGCGGELPPQAEAMEIEDNAPKMPLQGNNLSNSENVVSEEASKSKEVVSEQVDEIICPECKAINALGSTFCYDCGFMLSSNEEKTTVEDAVEEKTTVASLEAIAEAYANAVEKCDCENAELKTPQIQHQHPSTAQAISAASQAGKSLYTPQVVNIPVSPSQSLRSEPLSSLENHVASTAPSIASIAGTLNMPMATNSTAFNVFTSPTTNQPEVSIFYNSEASFIEDQSGVLCFKLSSNIAKHLVAAKGLFKITFGGIEQDVELKGVPSNQGLMLAGSIQIPTGRKGLVLVDGVIHVWFAGEHSEIRYDVSAHTYTIREAKATSLDQINIAIDQSGNEGLIHGNNTVYIPGLEGLNSDSRQENAYKKEYWKPLQLTKLNCSAAVHSIALVDENRTYAIINSFDGTFIAGRTRDLKGKNFCVRHRDKNICALLSGEHIKFKLENDFVDVIETSTNGAHFVGGRNNSSDGLSIGKISVGELKNLRCTRSRCSTESLVDLRVALFKDSGFQNCGGIGLIVSPKSKAEGWCSRSEVLLNILPEKTISIDKLLGIQGECNEFSNKNEGFQYRKNLGNWSSLRDGDKLCLAGKNLTVKFIYE